MSNTSTLKPIEAKPLPHPWRWATAVILLALAAWFIYSASQNEAFRWETFRQYLFDQRVGDAAVKTILITIGAMLIGVILGSAIAVLRMSPNPVLRGVAWVYLWVFRGTPVYVQLVFWGLAGTIFQSLSFGFYEIDLQTLLRNTFMLAIIGLGLNEAAYMAEIVRSGIQAVPEGQTEASKALGMSWWQTIRRTVLPQAMRIIIPPTGNEFISLLKTTSLVVAIPYTGELYGRSMDIANALFQPVPMLLVAAFWYLVITTVLMIGQYYLEKYFEKGAKRELTARQLAALADAEGALPKNVEVVEPHQPRKKPRAQKPEQK